MRTDDDAEFAVAFFGPLLSAAPITVTVELLYIHIHIRYIYTHITQHRYVPMTMRNSRLPSSVHCWLLPP
jgi:hypothetical protein